MQTKYSSKKKREKSRLYLIIRSVKYCATPEHVPKNFTAILRPLLVESSSDAPFSPAMLLPPSGRLENYKATASLGMRWVCLYVSFTIIILIIKNTRTKKSVKIGQNVLY